MPTKLILVIAAIFMVSGGAGGQTLRIGLSGPFTGRSESMGVAMRDGAKLAATDINANGGILGMQLVLIERDDQSRPERGVQVTQELIGVEHVVATVGFVNNDVALASQPLYQAAEIPVMTAVATGTAITLRFQPPDYKANYIFRVAANDTVQAAMIVGEAVGRRHFTAPAVLAEGTPGETAGREELLRALAAAHISPAADQTFDLGAVDLTTQLARIKRSGADVILTYGRAQEQAAIANSMAVLGWKLPVIGNAVLASAGFLENAAANGDGSSMPQTFIQNGNTPRRAAFVAAYWARYRVGRLPAPDCAAQGYDSVVLLKAAIEQAKSTDGPKIREALEHLRYRIEGVITTYDHPFSATDHEAIDINIPVFGIAKFEHVVEAHEDDVAPDRAVRTKQ